MTGVGVVARCIILAGCVLAFGVALGKYIAAGQRCPTPRCPSLPARRRDAAEAGTAHSSVSPSRPVAEAAAIELARIFDDLRVELDKAALWHLDDTTDWIYPHGMERPK